MSERRNSRSMLKPTTWPRYFEAPIVSFLQTISLLACTHPVRTTAFVAAIASFSYIGLLDSNLFEPPALRSATSGQINFSTFLEGSKTLHVGPKTDWKWQQDTDIYGNSQREKISQQLALITLVFPDISLEGSSPTPSRSSIPQLKNSTINELPVSKNFLYPISQEKTIAFSAPYDAAQDLLASIKDVQVPDTVRGSQPLTETNSLTDKEKRWVMSAVKDSTRRQRSLQRRFSDAWIALVDILKNAETLDIIIMVLGYLSMHLTFVSLFISLRRLGSHFWLGTTVLLSSAFACLFGVVVTTWFGVPLNIILLSEGLPFLVVIIGFGNPIILTKAVLSASVALRKPSVQQQNLPAHRGTDSQSPTAPNIQDVVQIAVKETGYDIVIRYVSQIAVLSALAATRIQGGLCQFCFLAAWILFFDGVLLFTLYTSVLTIKLEINRIKRHVTLRRALEEDGVSRRVAEEVASTDEWPNVDAQDIRDGVYSPAQERSLFGMKAQDSSILKFKVWMVAGFILINLVNSFSIPFRSGAKSAGSALFVTQPPMDPYRVAGSGLDQILTMAKKRSLSVEVTVLSPIKYEIESPLIAYSEPTEETGWLFDLELANQILESVSGGGKVVEGVLKSFEDPNLIKWVISALLLSLALNGYLFNAARWSIKDPDQLVNEIRGRAQPPQPSANGVVGSTQRNESDRTSIRSSVPEIKTQNEDEGEGPKMKESKQLVHRRTKAECEEILREKRAPVLHDEDLIDLSLRGKIPGYALEKALEDKVRAVKIRRAVVARTPATMEFSELLESSKLPYENYDYDLVHGACCENVIGYLPLPLGVAGPLNIDGQSYFLPMATTEGVLVASTSRGCKAINAGGGAITVLTGDGMTRGPCVAFATVARAGQAKIWIDSEEGQRTMKEAFDSTSRFARLQNLKASLAGTYLYVRFKTTTGDAMGMNMISKGVEVALDVMRNEAGFEDMAIISVSGNFCIDKKPAAINWIDGRGKSVVAEAVIPGEVVRSVLKSDVNALVELNTSKNLIGSAMAGSIGGNNAHAANIVSAMFLATGQDPAQNVESSNCITVMKNLNGNLQISVSMPCIEVGTIGGGTFLPPQAAMLDLLGVRGAHQTSPGANSRQLARIIGAGVLAGELSLCSALAAGHLVKAHMQHNRSQQPTRAPTPTATTPTTLAMTTMTEASGR